MKKSAGILAYCRHGGEIKILIVHPGGPFFKNRDLGVWSIPKGEFEVEDPKACAIREFEEETGYRPPDDLAFLGEVRYRSGGKVVLCWTGEMEYIEDLTIRSNTFEIEWPPRSGRIRSFPEVDKGRFVTLEEAKGLLQKDQIKLLDALEKMQAKGEIAMLFSDGQ
jgi:predicted NUDIX family NTP pyrophosphohydrolase